jgi:hypothetical protein
VGLVEVATDDERGSGVAQAGSVKVEIDLDVTKATETLEKLVDYIAERVIEKMQRQRAEQVDLR